MAFHAEPAQWVQVRVGEYILDSTNRVWLLKDEKSDADVTFILLVDKDGNQVSQVRPPDSQEVTRWVPSPEDAAILLERELGARQLNPLRVFKLSDRVAEARNHLWICHGIPPNDIQTIKDARKCHEELHAAIERGDPDTIRMTRAHIHSELTAHIARF